MIRVTVWNEYLHERELPSVKEVYPEGIHGAIAEFLSKKEEIKVQCSTFFDENQGISRELLEETDVLIWWSHARNEELTDENAGLVAEYVRRGMGFIALHSAHMCKPLKLLLGSSMTLKWRDNDSERIFVTAPAHPIASGLPEYFDLPHEEMYGEFFDIPKPDDVIFTGWFKGGCVFRSGVTFTRGNGRIFYFQPGHETYPIYRDENIQRIITNAVFWASGSRLSNLRDNVHLEEDFLQSKEYNLIC